MLKPRAQTPQDHTHVRVTQVGVEMDVIALVSKILFFDIKPALSLF